MSHFAPAPSFAGPTLHGMPARRRLVAAVAAVALAVPGTVFVVDAITGDAPAPQLAKKGSFDITA